MKITKKQAVDIGKKFNLDFDVVKIDEWHCGLNIELEHGKMFGKIANVTNNDIEKTAKIVLAHLIEDPRYYKYLQMMEKNREKYWETRKKPSIFKKIKK